MTARAADIKDDLERVLALAKAAFEARDDAAGWRTAPERQIGHHGARCDALWEELERLVQARDGRVPTLEHPAARERRIASRIRRQIVAEVLSCAEERLTEMVDGTHVWEDPNALPMGWDEL